MINVNLLGDLYRERGTTWFSPVVRNEREDTTYEWTKSDRTLKLFMPKDSDITYATVHKFESDDYDEHFEEVHIDLGDFIECLEEEMRWLNYEV